MNRIAIRSLIVLVFVLVLVVGFGLFVAEYITKSPQWLVSDSSPFVDKREDITNDQRAMAQGIVQDRDGEFLLDLSEDRVYSKDAELRKSTIHWLGGRDGNIYAPILSNYKDAMLGYDLATGTYTYGDNTVVMNMTLSSKIQKAALQALGDYKGTVGVYNYKTGELLCSVTTPTYDPDNVPADIETNSATNDAYRNKFTRITYAPGSIFKIVTLAAAIEELDELQSMSFYCDGSYEMGANTITCTGNHGTQNIKTAFRNSCNCAFAQLSEALGAENLEKYVEKYGVIESISFDGVETKEGNFETDPLAFSTAWSAMGQFEDMINPCTYMTFVGAIANDGVPVIPYVVEKIGVENKVTYRAETVTTEPIMSVETARILQEYMRSNVQEKYGDDNFPGMAVCAKTGTAEVGGDKNPNAMFTGFVLDDEYPLAFIICVEDAGSGERICKPIASKVLAACKEVLDS